MRENRNPATVLALAEFTRRYVGYWQQTTGGLPVSQALPACRPLASPAVTATRYTGNIARRRRTRRWRALNGRCPCVCSLRRRPITVVNRRYAGRV